jgi:NAD(P)H-dependent FMN reductase
MRIMLRWLHAWPVPEQLSVGHVKEAFDDDGQFTDPKTVERLHGLVDSVLQTAEMLNSRDE